jgi:RNA polymerase sigma-70 factor (ECF subfamily)
MDWEKAYRDHHREIFAHLYRRSGGNTELARDLTQDVFVRAMRSEKQFSDHGRGLMPWLTTIAQNLLADYWKSPKRHREDLVEELPDDRTVRSAEADALERLRAAEVMRAVARLDPEQRDPIVLSYWGCMPDEQIGRLLGVNTRTVNTRRYRGRQHLRYRLAEVA